MTKDARVLPPAVESSIINSTMLVQISLLAWLFLGETLTVQDLAGIALVGIGIVLVQLRWSPKLKVQGSKSRSYFRPR